MKYYIVTGVGQGLGEALAKRLVSKDVYLFCISRKRNERLIELAAASGYKFEFIECDLSQTERLEGLMAEIFGKISSNAEQICLINNAAVLKPIKPIGGCLGEDINYNVLVNLTAPMILTSEFIKRSQDFTCEKVVINISSGAGKKPYHGWGNYCTTKAGLDMFTRCCGVEQKKAKHPVRVISFAPGIIDTNMQGQIRQSSPEDFDQVERFIQYKNSGALKEPDFVAEKVIEVINKQSVEGGAITDISDFL